MAASIKLKKSAVAGKVPLVADLDYGELAINYADGIIFFKNSSNQITRFFSEINLDSAAVIDLIDSSYVQARQDFAYSSLTGAPNVLDSADVSSIAGTISGLDSNGVRTLVDSAYVQSRQITYTIPTLGNDFVDSGQVTSIVDSAYIQARQTAGGSGTVDSADIIAIVDSAYVQARQADAAGAATTVQNYYYTADSAQTTFSGADDFSRSLSYTVDKIQVYLNGILLKDSDDYTASNGTSVVLTQGADSSDILSITTYVTAAAGTLDSAGVLNLIDASYIQSNQTTYNTSDFADSAFVTTQINAISIPTLGNDFVDSEQVQLIVDSAYIQLRQSSVGSGGVDSATVSSIISADVDSAYVQARQITYTIPTLGNDFVDSGQVTNIIDASYIQSNQIKYNTSDFADSAFVTAQINNLIDGAPGTLDTLNEIAAALNDDDSAYTTLVNLINAKSDLDSAAALNLINAAYIQSNQITYNTSDFADSAFVTSLPVSTFTNDANYLDSTTVQGVINASYIQSNQTTYNTSDFADSAFVTSQINAISIPTLGNDFVDSAQVQLIVDSAYIQARQTAGGSGGLDSALTISLIDSNYVQARQSTVSSGATTITNYTYTATSGQTTFTGADDNGSTLSYTVDKLNVYLNGILLLDSADYTATNGTSVVLTSGANTADAISIITYVTAAVGTLDSAGVTNLIDSAYVQSRQITYTIPTLGNDFVDSGQVQLIVDSAYIQARQTAGGTDSATVISLITSTVDSAYVALREANAGVSAGGLDSAAAINLIDSAYVQARQSTAAAGATTITTYDYIATAGQTTFTGGDIDGASLSYTPGKQQVFVNGVLLVDSNDYTATSGSSIVLGTAADSNDVVSVIAYVTQTVGTLDSTGVTNLIDSAYIQLRQSSVGSGGVDSAAVSSIILADVDTAYVQARQIKYNTSDFTDSAFVTSQIAAISIPTLGNDFVDSGQVTNIVDNTFLRGLIDDSSIIVDGNGSTGGVTIADGGITIRSGTGSVAYADFYCEVTNAHRTRVKSAAHADYSGNVDVTLPTSTGTLALTSDIPTAVSSLTNDANYLDSTTVQGIIDSAYIQARQTSGGGTTQQAFKTISVSGQSDVVADDSADTLTFVAGSNVTITTDAGTDTITIASSAGGGGGGLDSALTTSLIDSNYVQARQSTIGSTTVQNYFYTSTSGQTSFSGSDDFSNTLSYTVDRLQVYLNGILLKDSDDYTASNGTSINLTSGAGLNDIIGVTTYIENNQYAGGVTSYDYVATSGQTLFSGADVNSAVLSYNSSSKNLNVFLNGILLRDSDDYTATTGNSVTLLSGAADSDALSVVVYGVDTLTTLTQDQVIALIDSDYVNARTGSLPWTEKTNNYTAVAGDKLFIDPASNTVTVTLPASPSLGDEIRIIDASGNAATNNITIARNGNKINGADSDLVIDVDRSAIGLAYYNVANGWVLIER